MTDDSDVRSRILDAAFAAFMKSGYAATSTLEIATRARVSKRELYAVVGNKQEMLVACIGERATRLEVPADLPVPRDRETLAQILTTSLSHGRPHGARTRRDKGRPGAWRLSTLRRSCAGIRRCRRYPGSPRSGYSGEVEPRAPPSAAQLQVDTNASCHGAMMHQRSSALQRPGDLVRHAIFAKDFDSGACAAAPTVRAS
jgi:AcrR family transcriptional regulator